MNLWKKDHSMRDVRSNGAHCKPPYNPNNTRVRELSRFARKQYPDGHGDYMLPETPEGRHLALALICCLARAGQRNGPWLFDFCCMRVPWLDPDTIDPARLIPDDAQTLGRKIGLTGDMRAVRAKERKRFRARLWTY
jgi:hypothetical protein